MKRALLRIWLALRIAFLEARIEENRKALARGAEQLDADRRAVNLAHQALAALDGRRPQTLYQLRGR